MQSRRNWIMLVGLGALMVLSQAAFAADGNGTTITVDGMHCGACAKKITTRLQSVGGVAAATADPKEGLVVVSAKPKQSPSPKALWEAVEKAGYTPTKLVGPVGTFTKKPRS